MMKSRYISVIALIALGLAGYAQTGYCQNNVASLAGVYSTAHPVTVDGVKVSTNGYLEIDPDGKITAFEQDGEGPAAVGSGCYQLSAGTATNAGLQARILTPGVSPRGDAVYQTLAGDGDTFGILVEPAANGEMKWFFHWGSANSTVTINGGRNVVNAANQSSYSISGPALVSPTPEQLHNMLCRADRAEPAQIRSDALVHAPQPAAGQGLAAAASNPVAASPRQESPLPVSMANLPTPLAGALPFDLGKPADTGASPLARLSIQPGSSKAKILKDWAGRIASDADIKAYFSASHPDPATVNTAALSHALGMLDGMQRISLEDREQMTGMTRRAFDNAPPDCGGTKSVSAVTSRYLSLETETDVEFQRQLNVMYDLMKQSTQNTPVPQINAVQRLQGQLAFSTSVANALKRNPSEANDLGLLMSGKQADLSPEAWCRATRFYQTALNDTAQPARDWVILAGIEDQKRLASGVLSMLKTLRPIPPGSSQFTVAPKVFDYAEKVRRHVRPLIIWSGTPVPGETVIEVRCSASGNLESARIVQSSGDQNWDSAVLSAVNRADPMPLDENGEAPRVFNITLKPAGA